VPRLKPAIFLLVAALASLVLAVPAQADIDAGVVDDTPVVTADGGAAFFALMTDVGLKEVRLTVQWDPASPTTIANQSYLESMVPVATLRGVRVTFSVQPIKARSVTGRPNGTQQFAAFVAQLATTFPTVKDFIIGNEPNLSYFWVPQFSAGGKSASPAAYEALLARSYDALKAVSTTNNVIGLGLSPRGNDMPNAPGNISHSPVKFLNQLGKAYRASRRTKPLMDMFAFHPYPKTDRDALAKGYPWPNAGIPNLGRIKQAFYDAFRGTAQKTFEQGLKVKLDEVGWQVGVVPSAQDAYFGAESIKPTSEATQASIYAALLRQVACDPSVDSVLFFGFQDEPNLMRWQSGLMRADGSKRASYDSVKATLAQTGGRCTGRMQNWRHSMQLEGVSAKFFKLGRLPSRAKSWSLIARAEEDALFDAGIHRFNGRPGARVLTKTGLLEGHKGRLVRLPSRRLSPGRYVFSIRFRAAMNPARTMRITGRPFTIYRAR
jgi:hypothetical protein